jgi:hypothetical protein
MSRRIERLGGFTLACAGALLLLVLFLSLF